MRLRVRVRVRVRVKLKLRVRSRVRVVFSSLLNAPTQTLSLTLHNMISFSFLFRRRETVIYNGYESEVGYLYDRAELRNEKLYMR